MATQWFYIIGKESHGPVSESQLEEIFLASMITRKTLVWNSKESNEWIPLEESDSLMERWGRRKLSRYGVGDVLYIRMEDGTIEKAKILKLQGTKMKVTFLIFGESFDEWIDMDSDRIQPPEYKPKTKAIVYPPRKRKSKKRHHIRTASVRLTRHPNRTARGYKDYHYSPSGGVPDFQEELYLEIGEAKRDLRKRERRLEERERALEVVQTDFEADRLTMTDDLRARITELDKVKNELSKLEKENTALKAENERLKRREHDNGMEIEQLRSQVHRMGSLDTEMLHNLQKEKIEMLQNELVAARELVAKLEAKSKSFEGEMVNRASEYEALETENKRLMKELDSLNEQKERFLQTDMYSLTMENESLRQKIEEGTVQFQTMKGTLAQLRESMKTLREELSAMQMSHAIALNEKRKIQNELDAMQEKYMKAVRLAMSQEQHIKIADDNMTPELQRNRSQLLMDDDSDDCTDIDTLHNKREILRVQSGVDLDDVSDTEDTETELTSIGEVSFGVRFSEGDHEQSDMLIDELSSLPRE